MAGVAARVRSIPRVVRGRVHARDGARFDRVEGVDTEGALEPVDLTIAEGEAETGFTYVPTPLRLVDAIVAGVPMQRAGAVFVDLGCGKGRVLLRSAQSGFAEVVGVEFAQELYETACSNAARFQAAHPDCSPIRVVLGDAGAFDYPSSPLVVHFNNPFAPPVMERVIDRLARSYADAPRPVVAVYQQLREEELRHRTPNADLLAASGFLTERPLRLRGALDRFLLGAFSIRCFASPEVSSRSPDSGGPGPTRAPRKLLAESQRGGQAWRRCSVHARRTDPAVIEHNTFMGWRIGEVWLDTDVLWFRERPRSVFAELALAAPAFAGAGIDALAAPIPTGLEASRTRRLAARAARKRRLATRTVPAMALVLGSSAMIPISAFRQGAGQDAGPLTSDPPSLTFRLDPRFLAIPEAPTPRTAREQTGQGSDPRSSAGTPASKAAAPEPEYPKVDWNAATSIGLPYSGRLEGGTQLPVEGQHWVTWNPAADHVPNLPGRLYGHERTIRAIISVATAYRAAYPEAQRLVVGDISLRGGGWMDQHVSHQNGLDVDVYYPRLDRQPRAPTSPSQVDRVLAQDLLDRFVAAGAQVVFVGYSTGLSGRGVAVPYPNHEDHMHVRFPSP